MGSIRNGLVPFACVLASIAAPGAAQAACSISGEVETCSGSVTGGAIVHNQNIVHTLMVFDLANTIDATDSTDASKKKGPVIDLDDPGGVTPAPSDWKDSNRNGQAGIKGAAGIDLSATISLDTGYGLAGASGVTLRSLGWDGSHAHEAQHTDKHATGGNGGGGGQGGDLSFTAMSNNGGKSAAAIKAGSSDSASTGIALASGGGDGGAGGWAHSSGGLKDAQGGVGGNGGAAGKITARLLDGHFLDYSGSGVGIAVTAQGGDGGAGGYGEVDLLDADSSYGGAGGTGGNGGAIKFTATSGVSTIVTLGVAGIALQSLGGNGGVGGAGKGGHDHAGDGGNAGNGGDITADLSVDVTTSGPQSDYGIYVKSAGGFAGDSGGDSGGIKNHPGNPGEPGQAGSIALRLTSSRIDTDNVGADGVLVQSVGGMGGNGGSSSGLLSYGSKGGSGGAGGAAAVSLDQATVSTRGDHAAALLVQSIGGAGGKAGKTSGITALAAAAGAGGIGGAASAALTDSTLHTSGSHATGVLVQSIGGGGGSSGAATGVYAVGGSGGLGGAGGTVDLAVDRAGIATQGDNAIGIVLQSIGAGGGESHSPTGAIALGQEGGGGGNGSTVTYSSQAGGVSVSTSGALSDAILIQSIGGGGGRGGSTFDALANFSHQVGASGGGGGSAGDIAYTGSDTDVISTVGDLARGVVLQSIGGGGGSGGNIVTISMGLTFGSVSGSSSSSLAEHHGGTVTADAAGRIITTGDGSTGVLAQSVGGGGGSAGNNISISVGFTLDHAQGASGQTGGHGGDLSVTSRADVQTHGADADGILVQSIGGGGGHSSNVVKVSAGVSMNGFKSQQGASGGAGGDGYDAKLTSSGSITTTGDNALGVAAQSIAGGGGKTGYTVTASSGPDLGSVTLGQSGGSGGKAGTVTLTNQGAVSTAGALASAILAQSIGGGGGHGGLAVNGDISATSVSLTQGGSGGKGGTGGGVTVDNAGGLITAGDGGVGILAQSLGGGGGTGGTTVHGAFSVVSLSSNLGGNGGDGGIASAVKVSNSGKIDTSGHQATGIFAQSLGGSGGKAGALANGTVTGGEVSGSLSLSVGGSGGKGGNAADVEVDQRAGGAISTKGHNANGINAQSIGGDGGSGGDVYSGSVAASQSGSLNVNVSVGGAGGAAGKAGKATVENYGGIDTIGAYADAIFAQSVGGNGGDAGSSYALTADLSGGSKIESTITVGGTGGSGAVASDVQVKNYGSLSTTGGNAAGIYAQSIGGNGGVGGYGLAFLGNFEATKENYVSLSADVEVGGSGGSGSHAGSVDVRNEGGITTNTDTSAAIWAQSIGGGGGDGGNAGAYTMGYLKNLGEGDEEPENKGFSLSVTVGGGGGGGGNGDTVTVSNTQTIKTSGTASYGIFAQSVGGGGGSGGNGSPGMEGWAADVYEDIEKMHQWQEIYEQYKKVKGKDWKGLFLESFSVDVGGSAGGKGDGGDVSVTNSGTIATAGDSATAIYAQSLGGGGGTGGDGSQGMLTSVTVSGSGGGGGNGGTITVDNNGTLKTSGEGAMGIYAQSLGGGGGSAGDVEGTIATGLDSLAEVVGYNIFGTGGSTGDGGDGGNVTIKNSGSIVTTGVNAHGIWAQSVGGGGGAASSYGNGWGDNGVGSDGLKGSSGRVSVNISGTIDVSGDGAHGIFLQSASGVGDASRAGGVDLTVSGSVKAAGAHARAILAQAASYAADMSTSNPSAGTVQITIDKGATVATTNVAAYETIAIKGGRSVTGTSGFDVSNWLYNSGTLASAGPGAVVLATDGEAGLLVHNMGFMSGSVSAGNQNAVHFYNYETGVFALGTHVNLGTHSGTFLQNGGSISASGLGVIGQSLVTAGSFIQNSAGKIQVDLSKANAQTALTGDQIVVDGGGNSNAAVTLAGSVKPNWVGGTSFVNGATGEFDILDTAQGQIIDNAKLAVANSATVAYSLRSTNGGSGLVGNYNVDYTGAASGLSLGENELSFANYFSSAMGKMPRAESMTDISRAMSLLATEFLNTMSGEALARAYGEHTLDESVIGAVRAVSSSHALHSLLQSCPNLDRPTTGSTFFRQRECAWVQLQGEKYRQDATGSMPGFKESVAGVSGAVQKKVGNGTFVEMGGKLEKVNLRGDNFSDDGYRVSAGVALKREFGIFTLSSTLGGGHYSSDKQRAYSLGGTRYQATADSSGTFITGEARISALLARNNFYVKPAMAISASRIWQGGYSESGSGPLNWAVDSISKTAIALHPSVEVGHAFDLSDRPAVVYARVGLTSMLGNNRIGVASRLVGDGASLGTLRINPATDRHQFEVTGGIDTDLGRNLSLSIQGQTVLSKNATSYGGFARMKYRY